MSFRSCYLLRYYPKLLYTQSLGPLKAFLSGRFVHPNLTFAGCIQSGHRCCAKDIRSHQSKVKSNVFGVWCWIRIMRIPWIAQITNTNVLEQVGQTCWWTVDRANAGHGRKLEEKTTPLSNWRKMIKGFTRCRPRHDRY